MPGFFCCGLWPKILHFGRYLPYSNTLALKHGNPASKMCERPQEPIHKIGSGCQATMAEAGLQRRSRPAKNFCSCPLPLLLSLAVLTVGGVLQSSVVVVASPESGEGFRCEREEDLDGSACRVDMLPDSALAEMVYER